VSTVAVRQRSQAPRSARPEARDTCPGCVALRADVAALVAQLGRRVEALEARRQKPDPAKDSALLSAIASAFGGAVFVARDLARAARTDRELAAVLTGVSVRRLGAWLRRLARTPGTPYRLRRVCRDGAGMLWTLDAE
jgi:hypothetical protein